MSDEVSAAPLADHGADRAAVVAMLHQGLELVADLNLKLQSLDDLMLSGRPQEIAAAATEVEAALSTATPTFSEIVDTMKRLRHRRSAEVPRIICAAPNRTTPPAWPTRCAWRSSVSRPAR